MGDDVTIGTPSTRRQGGLYFTTRQFLFLLSAVISVEVGINLFALKSFIHTTTDAVVKEHNVDPGAHSVIMDKALANDEKVIHRLDDLRTSVEEVREKVARVEGVLIGNGVKK